LGTKYILEKYVS